MKIDLEIYRQQFALESAKFVRIDHTDTIIAEVYKVSTSEEKAFILKICPRKEDYFREAYFLRRLDGCMPVPRIIATYEPSDDHFGAILMECLEGELLTNNDWTNDLAFKVGTSLAQLHSIRAESYGDLPNNGALFQNPNVYFGDKFEEELLECKGHLPDNLIENCASYLKRCQEHLANVDGPCFVHRDFRPGNMIVRQGRLQGIIDWSSARSGFAEQDFCSLEHFQWIPNTDYKTALLDGYSSIRPIPKYEGIMPLLQLGRSLAVIGYTVKSGTWNSSNACLYTFNRTFLEKFNFSS